MKPTPDTQRTKSDITSEERDRRVIEIYDRLLEIERRLIPTGLHVFGVAPDTAQLSALLQMVASFERADPPAPALTDLIASGLGFPAYSTLLAEGGTDENRLQQREQVEDILKGAIEVFLSTPEETRLSTTASFLSEQASIPPEESIRALELLAEVQSRLRENHELDALVRALRGEYIEPGPGADIIQNPRVLPTGRNTYAVNPYTVPSDLAVARAGPIVSALLERYVNESGCYPETIAMVLWGIDNIKSQGEAVAQALNLMGVMPRRDGLNRVAGVDVIPVEQLGRPRIDVVMTVSGIFRDLFAPTMELLDRAARTVAALDEEDDRNFVRKHVLHEMKTERCSLEDAATRVFSNAPGNYGTNVNFMVLDSQWEETEQLGDLFVTRKCFAYGRGLEGRPARELMDRALQRVQVTYQNIDSTEIGITDVDHYFEYLGGVSKAVEKRSGARPRIYLSDSTMPGARVRTLEETVDLETRTKTLNPKWYEGMLKHGFSGVAEIEHHVTNTFGWSATTDAVDDWVYDEVAATYLLDEEMLTRLRALNPHSLHSMVGRLLEASGRGFWSADETTLNRLRGIFSSLEDEMEGVTV